MPIIYTIRSIFDLKVTQAEVLVNPVNCVGVMGAGLAAQFRYKYPDMFTSYKEFCDLGMLYTGNVRLVYASDSEPHSETRLRICLFPTKRHFRDDSKPEYIQDGLRAFRLFSLHNDFGTISFPKLGCGLGGLDWKSQVQPLMHKYLDDLPNRVYVHAQTKEEFL